MHFARNNTKTVILFLALFSLTGCFHLRLGYHGTIKDADSNKPLEGAVAFLSSAYTCILPPNPAGSNSNFLAYVENTSDGQGKYSIKSGFHFLPPLLCFTNEGLQIAKAGYFTSRINDPSFPNEIDLYPIHYYLDYLECKKNAAELSHTYENYHASDIKMYLRELTKMAEDNFQKKGEEGVFLELPGTRLTSLICGFGEWVDRLVDTCSVFDEVTRKWLVFNTLGHAKIHDAPLSYRYRAIHVDNKTTDNDGNFSLCTPTTDRRSQKCMSLPIGDNVEAVVKYGNAYFVISPNAIRKYVDDYDYYPDRYGSFRAINSFYDQSLSLLQKNRIVSAQLGILMSKSAAIYITTGGSKIYRLNLDGLPDYRIDILTSISAGH